MKYNRILLKLSGESLQGTQKYGLSTDVLHSYAEQIKAVVGTGVQVGIVIGGGNIFRGLQGARKGFDRVKGDQMGMLATIINSLALQSVASPRYSHIRPILETGQDMTGGLTETSDDGAGGWVRGGDYYANMGR